MDGLAYMLDYGSQVAIYRRNVNLVVNRTVTTGGRIRHV